MLKSIIFSFVKLFPPELSHSIVIILLRLNPFPRIKIKKDSALKINLLGYKLSNPLGLAAGFDKNGDALNGLIKLNFSFIEIGTITPLAQDGNKLPRVHRFYKEKAIVNSLGFPNKGINCLVEKLSKLRVNHRLGSEPIIGVNIGCNKKTQDPAEDYITCLRKVYTLADYVAINISSPNTPGLRNLQKKEKLESLLKKINFERLNLEKVCKRFLPLVVKVSPDLKEQTLKDLVNLSIKYKFNGIIATNTTINKNLISESEKNIPDGGISGKPLFEKSNNILKNIKKYSKNDLQIIGLGGIDDGKTANEKLILGASAIQIYTGLVFKGPSLIENILHDLSIIKEINNTNYD